MRRLLVALLALPILLIGACSGGGSQPVATLAPGPTVLADCQPRTVTFESDAPQSDSVKAVLPTDDGELASAIADSFCSSEWVYIFPDGTEHMVEAGTVLAGEDAGCIAGRLVELLGVARVTELGLGVGPWSLLGFGLAGNSGERPIQRAEAESIVDAFVGCSDQWKLLLILSVTEGADGIGDESAACPAGALADDDAAELLVGEIDRAYDDAAQPDAPSFADSIQPLVAAYDDCLSPTERDGLDFS